MIPKAVTIVNQILRSNFSFHTPLKELSSGTWSLNREYSSGETIDNKGFHYDLWPLLLDIKTNSQQIYCPLYFAFNIKLKVNEDISELNIKIFKEDILKEKETALIPTELLLRVEWSNETPKLGSKHVHAQPHWHIHSYNLIDVSERFPSFDEKTILELLEMDSQKTNISIMDDEPIVEEMTKQNDLTISKAIPVFKFHLSMLSDWHKQTNSPHNNILTDDVLKIWLPQCLSYIKDQIEYIYERI